MEEEIQQYEEEVENDEVYICGKCCDQYVLDHRRWICCDDCDEWFHLECSGLKYDCRRYTTIDLDFCK